MRGETFVTRNITRALSHHRQFSSPGGALYAAGLLRSSQSQRDGDESGLLPGEESDEVSELLCWFLQGRCDVVATVPNPD